MKYKLIIDKNKEESIVITAHEKSQLILDIESLIKNEIYTINGYKDDKIFTLELERLYAFYTSNGKVYAVCEKDEYLVKERIYQIEELVSNTFIKINQGCIINVKKISRFESNIGGSIKVILRNDFSDYISRRELKNVKRRMGLWENTL